jgi:transketolase
MTHHLNENELKKKARHHRRDIIKMLHKAGSGHPGGSLSSIDILTVLYHNVLRHNPEDPNWADRDRFVLSKGHICPALYSILSDFGYFEREELKHLRQYGCMLQGHPCMHHTPGLEISSGSLGQGLSVAVGIALGARMNKTDFRTYCLMGDGELQEGQVWEASMAAGHYKLDNLCAIVDKNGLQIDGKVDDVMTIDPLTDKFLAFNWNVIEIDGHEVLEIENAFRQASQFTGKPTVIIAHTVKGKGVSYMENAPGWHGVAPDNEQLEIALAELKEVE